MPGYHPTGSTGTVNFGFGQKVTVPTSDISASGYVVRNPQNGNYYSIDQYGKVTGSSSASYFNAPVASPVASSTPSIPTAPTPVAQTVSTVSTVQAPAPINVPDGPISAPVTFPTSSSSPTNQAVSPAASTTSSTTTDNLLSNILSSLSSGGNASSAGLGSGVGASDTSLPSPTAADVAALQPQAVPTSSSGPSVILIVGLIAVLGIGVYLWYKHKKGSSE